MFQVAAVKVRLSGLAVPSLASPLRTVIVTGAEGRLASFTVKVEVPPASVACPLTGLTTRALSSSTMVTLRAGREQFTVKPRASVVLEELDMASVLLPVAESFVGESVKDCALLAAAPAAKVTNRAKVRPRPTLPAPLKV